MPPSLSEIIPVDTDFPNCQMLHSNLAVAWSVFAPSITIQLIGNVDENDYIGFGFSKPGASKMVGSDVAIAYVDGLLVRIFFFSKIFCLFTYLLRADNRLSTFNYTICSEMALQPKSILSDLNA